jgi:hypothetical protein
MNKRKSKDGRKQKVKLQKGTKVKKDELPSIVAKGQMKAKLNKKRLRTK